MKINKYVEDLKNKSAAELNEELVAAKKELFNLRFQNATNQLDNTSRILFDGHGPAERGPGAVQPAAGAAAGRLQGALRAAAGEGVSDPDALRAVRHACFAADGVAGCGGQLSLKRHFRGLPVDGGTIFLMRRRLDGRSGI